jgi:hypothetical protein
VRVSDYNRCTEVPAGALETPAYDSTTGIVLGWHDLITALMAVDTQTGTCSKSLMALDPETGERVIVSR